MLISFYKVLTKNNPRKVFPVPAYTGALYNKIQQDTKLYLNSVW